MTNISLHYAQTVDGKRKGWYNISDSQGRLKAEYTIEGMHINPAGCRAIFDDLMRYVTEE